MAEKLRPLDQVEMGRRVRSRREAIGLSRENLAEQLDVSAQFIADIEYGHKGISIKKLNILVKGNHLSGELETVCPGRRKPIYMWRSRCPEDADLQDSCRQVVKFIRSFPDSNHTPLS